MIVMGSTKRVPEMEMEMEMDKGIYLTSGIIFFSYYFFYNNWLVNSPTVSSMTLKAESRR